MTVQLLLIGLSILAAGFFSGTETGAYRLNRIRLRKGVESGSWTAWLLDGVVANMQRFVCVSIVGVNIAVYAATGLCTSLLIPRLKNELMADLAATLLLTPALLILADVIPKSLFQVLSDSLMRWCSLPLWVADKLLLPVTALLQMMLNFLHYALGGRADPRQTVVTAQFLSIQLAAGTQDGVISAQQDIVVRNIMQLGARGVRRVMVPLERAAMLSLDVPRDEAIRAMAAQDHEFFPVYEGTRENVIGIVQVLDFVCEGSQAPLGNFVTEPVFLKSDLTMDDAFRRLQQAKHTMGIVVDARGNALGIVTVDDLLRELFSSLRPQR